MNWKRITLVFGTLFSMVGYAFLGNNSANYSQVANASTNGAGGNAQSASGASSPIGASGSSAGNAVPQVRGEGEGEGGGEDGGAPAQGAQTQNAPTQTQTQSAPAPKPTQPAAISGTYTGSSVNVYYGNVEVQAVVKSGKLTAVNVLQYPTSHSTSVYINKQALPMLQQEAVSAQSANINLISGATATSEGFRQSLASAIAQIP